MSRLPRLSAALLATLLAACVAAPPDRAVGEAAAIAADSARANAFFERAFDERLELSPTFATALGLRIRNGEWGDNSEAGDRALRDLAARQLTELRATVDRERLDPVTQQSHDLFVDDVERRLVAHRWRNHGYIFEQMNGLHTRSAAMLINSHQILSEADAQDYISRLRGLQPYFTTAVDRARRAERRGVLAPRFVFAHVATGSRNIITGRPFDAGPADSPLYADIKAKLAGLELTPARREELHSAARAALLESVGPAYQGVIEWAESAAERASADAGVWKLPHGEAYYEFLLGRYTTTDLSAQQIHDLGLAEVARLHGEMRRIMLTVGFEGDLAAFFTHLRRDERFYYPDTAAGRSAYLATARGFVDAMRAKLPELFKTLPVADLEVRAVEPFREQSAGKAFYQRPSADNRQPGAFYVNLSNMREMPRYELEALVYHEGIPGHHLQIALAGEQQALPRFRRFGGYTAYSEGWGLYSERLPKELGFYADPYSDFGRLTLELLRAVRLVVDTGLHALGWTREQVIRYHLDNTPMNENAAVRATERYIVMPGQATAYTIGMLKILELREQAARDLGGRFDIREFHEVVLRNGALPLRLLEREVAGWIAAQP